MTEIWKDIPGYKGRYQASTKGRIRSVDHRVRVVAHGTEATRFVRGRVLRPGQYCKSGHVSVVLGHGAKGSPVHQLVALTFLGPVPDGCEVCHNDGNPRNNAVENLRYDTRTENIIDVMRLGRRWRKLCMAEVKEIRALIGKGYTGVELSRIFNVSQTTISSIKHGRTFGWVK